MTDHATAVEEAAVKEAHQIIAAAVRDPEGHLTFVSRMRLAARVMCHGFEVAEITRRHAPAETLQVRNLRTVEIKRPKAVTK